MVRMRPFVSLSAWRRRLLLFGRNEGAPLREGNVVALYPDGGRLLAASRELIEASSRSIDVEMYIWADDEVGRGMAEAMEAAFRRGVAVRVLYDAFGSFGSTAHLARLAKAGATVEAYHPVRLLGARLNRRNHRKLLIVDDTVAVLGGANWSNDYDSARFPEAFFDVGVGLAGPVVGDLCLDFRRVFRTEGRPVLPPPAPPRAGLLPPGPRHEGVPVQAVSGFVRGERSTIRRLYGLLLKGARSEILVANSYFVPGPRLSRLFGHAARRGVAVTVLVPGTSDVPVVTMAARSAYGRLLRAGVRVFERYGRMIHAKAAVVDGEVAVVGSANLDTRSFRLNLELNVNVHHADLARELAVCLRGELAQSGEVTLEAWRRRPFFERVAERVLYWLRAWL